MLFGRTSTTSELEWEKIPERLYFGNKVIQTSKLDSLLEDPGRFHYYVFSWRKMERFVFITKEQVCFKQLSSSIPKEPETYGSLKAAKRAFLRYAIEVEGMLYDLQNEEFVFGNDSFMTFVITDCGIPNVVHDKEPGQYIVFALDHEDMHVYYPSFDEPICVSHLWKKEGGGSPINNRIVFLTDVYGNEHMLLLHDEVTEVSFSEYVSFVETLACESEAESKKKYFRYAHGAKSEQVRSRENLMEFGNHLLVADDAIVVRQPSGDYNIIFVDNGKWVYNDSYDCYWYHKVRNINGTPTTTNIVEVNFRRNDFENGTARFDITSKKCI